MEFPKFTTDLSIISKLGDNPGTDDGLSAEELKAKFDEASLLLQAYLNGTLVEMLNSAFAGGDSAPVDGLNMSGAINMNRNPLQNVREPQSDHEAMNLGYAKEHFVPNERTVNGKALATDIALNAEDVGARSETWLPTVAEIGAAPGGYGLGESWGKDISGQDLITAKASGWYFWGTATNAPVDWGTMFVNGANASAVTQICFHASYPRGSVLVRYSEGETWTPWEWDNPPMELGKEYRTTERWNGKPVYVTLLNFGALPNNGRKGVVANINNASKFYIVGGLVAYLTKGLTINGVGYDGEVHGGGSHIMITSFSNQVVINTDYDASGISAYVLVKSVQE